MCSKVGQSGLFTFELPALIVEKTIFDLGMLDSGEQLLPFWRLVYYRVLNVSKDAVRMANSVDPDQTAPIGAIWSESALFAIWSGSTLFA